MLETYNEILQSLEENIKHLETEHSNQITLAELSIEVILQSLKRTKKFILNKGFADMEEEIYFFKKLKPVILSKLIYYNAIHKVETKRPHGGEKVVKKYLNREIVKLKRYFNNNREFYKYYRTSSSYLDHKYFVRGKYDIKLSLDTYYFETDHRFSTSHDYKVAKIIANDLIQVYIEDQLSNNNQRKSLYSFSLNWSESKTALTELIYALHSQGAFGNADIIAIAKTFESTFNISLGDFYHTFMELKSRKINRTKFLDSLRDALSRKMDEEDEV